MNPPPMLSPHFRKVHLRSSRAQPWCPIRVVFLSAAVLWFQLTPANARPGYTTICVTGTSEAYMPNPEDGRCYCGSSRIDPKGGYANGHCTPYPRDEGLFFGDCKLGVDDTWGSR